jgi:glutaredoxin
MINKKLIIALFSIFLIGSLILFITNKSKFANRLTPNSAPNTLSPESAAEEDSSTNGTLEAEDNNLLIDEQESPTSTDSQDLSAPDDQTEKTTTQYILFYGETCPYCHDVLDWMEESNIESMLDITTREVYNNPQYSEQLKLAAGVCNQSQSGVPFLYVAANKECVVGSTPIIDYLSAAAGL